MSFNHVRDNRVLLHPVLSGNNEYIAIINQEQTLLITSARTGQIVNAICFPKTITSFVAEVNVLSWAPRLTSSDENHSGVQKQDLKSRVLLAGGSRLLVLEVNLSCHEFVGPSHAVIVADYLFESQYGKIIVADFVFDLHQVLVTFKTNVHASIVHLTKLQRDDIPLSKYQDHRGFAQSTQHQYFALLQRIKGQDQVAVFVTKEGDLMVQSVFSPGTTDAQCLRWSPLDDPILAVWDSAAYGPRILFFTALGHSLKQLDVLPENPLIETSLPHVPGIGVSEIAWTASAAHHSMLAFSIDGSCLVLRDQDHTSLVQSLLASCQHQSIINGMQCVVWQQAGETAFESQKAVFEVGVEASSEINLIEINCDSSLTATRIDTTANALWVWNLEQDQPIAMSLFQHDIKSVSWHPHVSSILVVITNDKRPGIYIWNVLNECPKRLALPFDDAAPISRWRARWLSLSKMQRCPLLVSSNRRYEAGLISQVDGEVLFESILRHQEQMDSGNDDSRIETPSKPGRLSRPSIGWSFDNTTGTWDTSSDAHKW